MLICFVSLCFCNSGVHSDDVDIFMGTLTKSFASVGGYIAGSKDLIDVISLLGLQYWLALTAHIYLWFC